VEQNWFFDKTKAVRAEHVNAFVVSTLDILKRMGNIDASIKEVRKGKGEGTLHPISILIGLTGDLKGTFIIRFEELTACAIGASMMGLEKLKNLNKECEEALAELCNIIVGNAAGQLADLGVRVMITPPIISHGSIVPLVDEYFIVPLDSNQGEIELNLSFDGPTGI